MVKPNRFLMVLAAILLSISFVGAKTEDGCDGDATPRSASGVSKATAHVATGSDGMTTEQRNVKDRLAIDNLPGSIKHLYVISPYSGQVIIYSTVRGKVTSGGKRLTPETTANGINASYGSMVEIGGYSQFTHEVLQDDGTYGHSNDYIFWFDTKGVYHQHAMTGGQIVHVSSEPLAVKGVIINMELTRAQQDEVDAEPVKVPSSASSARK